MSSSRSASRMSAITGVQRLALLGRQRRDHVVEQRVVAVERDQAGRFESDELANEFGADRAAGAGDEHAASGDEIDARRQGRSRRSGD